MLENYPPHKLTVLGHGNVALSIILDIGYACFGRGFDVTIVRNIPSGDKEEDRLDFLPEGISADTMDISEWKAGDGAFIPGAFQPAAKRAIVRCFHEKAAVSPDRYANVIHPTSVIPRSARLGKGICLSPGVVLAPFCALGDFVSVNRNASIGHHTSIGDYSTINPGANIAGTIKIGKNVFIGMGSNIVEKITIGDNSVIGAGSLVTRSIPENVVAYGAPAKVVRERDSVK